MDAKESAFHSFLSQQIIMNVPIYQRKYNWSQDECKQLFNDILTIGEDDSKKSYFIGSIVFKKEDSDQIGGPDSVVLIDGQQRVTTITLIYCAICDYYKESNPSLCNYYRNNFLVNNDIENSDKLNLTKDDDFTLKRIVKALTSDKDFELKDEDAVYLYKNYIFFKNIISEDNIEILRRGLDKLLFISVGLGSDDNPQLIFESLNSTGLELKKNDLIRNYILMGLDSQHQNELYEEYWYEIEQGFKNDDSLFDDFIRYYLAVKNKKLPTKYNVYKDFKTYSMEFECIDDLVKDVYKFSKYFFNILYEQEQDSELLEAFKSLNDLEYNLTLPFLLSVYDDYVNSEDNPEINLTKEDFIEIVEYVESYLLRRSICEIPTNSLNNLFARLSSDIVDKSNYLECFLKVMAKKDGSRRFPTDTEVRENLLIKNLYSKKKILGHILINIENSTNKAIVNLDETTIEHIMPQKLSPDWINQLGDNYEEIHEKYLHTLGNLTLTFYNPEMSNKSFNEKKTIKGGFIDSKLDLNKPIAELDSWGEDEIKNRAYDLTSKIIDLWKYPGKTEEITEIVETIDEIEEIEQYTLDDFNELEERTSSRQLFDTLNLLILNIDSSIKRNVWKTYVAYTYKDKNFVEIKPQKKGLRIILDIPINQINDLKQICDDVSDKSVGSGDTGLYLRDENDVNYVMGLIKQSYEYNAEQGYEQRKLQDTIDNDEICSDFSCAISKLEKTFDNLELLDEIKLDAEEIYSRAVGHKLLKGRTKEAGNATSLYIACRLVHAPFNKDEIATIFGVKPKQMMKLSKIICNKLDIDLPLEHPKDYVSRYCDILDVSEVVEERTNEICDEAVNSGVLGGRPAIAIAASALYLSSVQMGEKRTQGEIADITSLSEVAIRNNCKLLKQKLNI